jgi:hypothetical protein
MTDRQLVSAVCTAARLSETIPFHWALRPDYSFAERQVMADRKGTALWFKGSGSD